MNQELLERVCNAPGPSGFETEAQKVATEVLGACCDEVRTDRLGNVIALKKATTPPADGSRPIRVMLSAHMDEIGMMLKHIDDKGFIHFQPLGGLNPTVLVSQRVVIHGKQRTGGVIAPDTRPAARDKPTPTNDLCIDTGLPVEKVRQRVSVGDIITFEGDVTILNDDVYVGRNFDDRIGVYCMLEAMRQVGDTSVDVYAVSSVQEEVGLRGARVATYAIEPDIGVALDGSLAWTPYIPEHQALCGVGDGTGIYIMDGLTIGHPRLVKFLFDICQRFDIAVQKNIGGGTDAAAMQQGKAGALSTTVGAPVRYMHSTVQVCSGADMDATVAMLKNFMEHAHELLPDEN